MEAEAGQRRELEKWAAAIEKKRDPVARVELATLLEDRPARFGMALDSAFGVTHIGQQGEHLSAVGAKGVAAAHNS
jgi:hypothetical protein